MGGKKFHAYGATTFREDEVRWMERALKLMARSNELSVLVRHRAYGTISAKVARMLAAYQEKVVA